jgi:hypothetical protein
VGRSPGSLAGHSEFIGIPHVTVEQLTPDAVPALGDFLTIGFGFPVRPAPFSDAVLQWKYLSPIEGEPVQPRSILQWDEGRLVGHIGLNHRRFRLPDGHEISAIHPMDWLASATATGVGVSLMLRCFEYAQTCYAVGGTETAQRLHIALKFEPVAQMRVMRRVIRPWSRFRMVEGGSTARRLAGVAADYTRSGCRLWGPAQAPLTLKRVRAFGPEVAELVAASECKVCHSSRTAGLFNHLLAYPGGGVTGWLIKERAETVGIALLSVVSDKSTSDARIMECFLRQPDVRLWRGAVATLIREAAALGADTITGFASTPWMEDGLATHGFTGRHVKNMRVRDPGKTLPVGVPYHVTHLEADLGYV